MTRSTGTSEPAPEPEDADRTADAEPGHDGIYPDEAGGDPRTDAQRDAADVGGD